MKNKTAKGAKGAKGNPGHSLEQQAKMEAEIGRSSRRRARALDPKTAAPQFVQRLREIAVYWAAQPGRSREELCLGVVHSILVNLDGFAIGAPAYAVHPLDDQDKLGPDIAGGLHDLLYAKAKKLPRVRRCRVCDCTHTTPCTNTTSGVACHWVEKNLCSECTPLALRQNIAFIAELASLVGCRDNRRDADQHRARMLRGIAKLATSTAARLERASLLRAKKGGAS